MSNETSTQLIIGLPSVGKTTFIAALWHTLNNRNSEISLSIEKLTENRKYLNELEKLWLCYNEIGRTSMNAEKKISLKVIDSETNKVINLCFPDMSGESFLNDHWKNRKYKSEYHELLQNSNGALLFIHPQAIRCPSRIDSANEVMDLPAVEKYSENISEDVSGNDTVSWNADNSPTQVILIDLLQCILFQKNNVNTFKLSIIISAWDIVPDKSESTNRWLKDNLPLLYQFLEANNNFFDLKVFGISAQGCDYKNADEVNKNAEKLEILKRVIVKADNKISNDITLPIKWAIK